MSNPENAADSKVRVLFAANSFEAVGGVETSVLPWIEEAANRGFQIEFVLCRIRGARGDLLEARGIKVHHHRLYWHFRGFQVPNFWGIWQLSRRIRQEKYHSVIGLQPPSHYFVRMAILLSGYRPRVIAMEQLSYRNRALPYVLLDRLLSGVTEKMLCVSESLRREVIARSGLPPHRVIGIPHGINPSADSEPDPELMTQVQGRLVIGCVARLAQEKRQRFLIDCFERFAEGNPLRPILLLVGDEQEDPGLAGEVKERGLAGDVLVLGHRENIGGIYALLDILVLPSVVEGFGLAWAEAMACGIPVIVTRIEPMTEFIEDGVNGLLFDPDDMESLLGCLNALAGSPETRSILGGVGRQYVKRELDPKRQRRKYVDVFVG